MALWALLGLGLALAAPEVTAPCGRLRGLEEGQVHVFRGVPYAEAPVGDLRWRPPVAKRPWQGLRDALGYGDRCLSILFGDKSMVVGSEDCLYLNVYVPAANASELPSELPCLVWIHGGAMELGSSDEYNGTSLVGFLRSQGQFAILVTLDYRLNVFGFLASEHLRERDVLKSTGNYGIQDQRMALRWVQENIGAFGGDPRRVTIFGQSSGAESVSLHLTMERSHGLFSRAIMQSGGFSGQTPQPMHVRELWFQRLMRETRCHDVDCLLSLPAKELLLAYLSIPNGTCCSFVGETRLPWSAAIDGVELTAHPIELLANGQVHDMPILQGHTLHDGARLAHMNLSTREFQKLLEETYGASPEQAELYRKEHSHNSLNYSDGWWSLQRLMTDQVYSCPSRHSRRSLASSRPVYGYLWASSASHRVVNHSDDLPFVFMNLPLEATWEERQLAEEVAMSWYRFAAHGDPGNGWPKQSEAWAPLWKFQTASKGGSEVVDGSYRDAQCSFILEWLNRHLFGNTSQALPAVCGAGECSFF